MGLGVEALLIVMLVLANGAFAMSEIAIVSSRRARLRKLADDGSRGAAAALALIDQPNRFLSTVQVGITFVGTFAGAFGGATLARELAVELAAAPYVGPHAEAVAFGIVVVAIGYLSLVLGELAPKRLALRNPERIASLAARPMRLLSRAAAPLVAVLSVSTDLVLKLLPGRHESEPAVTEEEIRTMIAHGARTGIFQPIEREMLEGVFRLGDREAAELMTPRSQAKWIDLEQPSAQALQVIKNSASSSFPVVRGNPDRIVGLLEARDLIGLDPENVRLEDHLRRPVQAREDFPALQLIDLFRSTKSSLAIVVDEHGQALGVVEVMDLLEAIVGDLPQANEEYEPRVVQRADGSLLVDGRLSVGELKERLAVKHLGPAEETYYTLGGFVMHEMGQVPAIGDVFRRHGYRFEVVDMDGRRVDRVLISREAEAAAEDDAAGG